MLTLEQANNMSPEEIRKYTEDELKHKCLGSFYGYSGDDWVNYWKIQRSYDPDKSEYAANEYLLDFGIDEEWE